MHGIFILAVRISGIIIGLYAIKAGASWVYTASTSNDLAPLWLLLTANALMVCAAICMILFPGIVAGILAPQKSASNNQSLLSSYDIELLAYSLFGLYLLIQAVLDASYLTSIWYATISLSYPWTWSPEYVAMTVTMFFELAVAIFLLFGGRVLSIALKWARKASLNPDL